MERLASFSRTGNQVLTILAMILVLLLFSYGGYSLYDDWLVAQGGFSSDLMQFKPAPGEMYSLSQLAKINPDVIGWITVDDSQIDQPITQGKDDMEYVNKTALGKFSLSGSIFLSCLNASDFSDSYMLTYGHHMASGGMYGDVIEFMKEDFFNAHKTGSVYTLDSVWDLKLFAVVETQATNSTIYNVTQYQGSGVAGLNEYLKEHSEHYRDINIQNGDQIISLSTCYDVATNERVVLFGRLENKHSGGEKANDEKSI